MKWLPMLVVVASACTRSEAPTAPPATERGAVVYGEDGRVDWFDIDDEPLKREVHDVAAAMIPWDYLASDESGAVTIYGEPTLGESYGLCADQLFRDQPTAAMCSGTLIDDDLILTAGHCVPDEGNCAGSAWVFDYLYTAEGVRAPMTADSVYRCVDVIVRPGIDLDEDIDLSVIQLDRPVIGRVPAIIEPERPLAAGALLTLVGYPNGIPLKVDAGGEVAAPRTQQGNYFVAAVDAFSGNSGSGVLGRDRAVLGVLVSGADDYANAGSCAVVATLDPSDAEEAVMYAHHAATALCERGFPSVALCPGGEAASCGDGFCTGGESADGCALDCDRLFAVPDAWTCDAGWYGVGDDCDCDCGAFDPDCDNHQLDVVNCAPGSVCNPDGTCKTPIPAEWVCARFQYADGDRCNCDCGALDPDCENASLDQTGCAPGGECQADGTCTVSLPAGWECRRRFYGTGDGCDCDCGARDPDCDDPAQQVFGCTPGTACLADGSCEVPIPAAWVCDASTFGAGDACDCRCGMHDPDCDSPNADVRNCQGDEVCGDDGTCAARVIEPEPEPEAGPESVEVAEEIAEPAAEEVAEEQAESEDDVAADAGEDVGIADTADTSDSGAVEAESGKGGKRSDDGCAGGGGESAGLVAAMLLVVRRRVRLT